MLTELEQTKLDNLFEFLKTIAKPWQKRIVLREIGELLSRVEIREN